MGGEGRTKVKEEQLLRVFEAIVSSHDEQETPDLRRGMREPLVLSFRLNQRPGEGICFRIDISVRGPETNTEEWGRRVTLESYLDSEPKYR